MAKKGKGKQVERQGAGLESLPADKMQQIEANLNKYNESFSTLLSMVPAKFYLHAEDIDGDEDRPKKKLNSKAAKKQAAKEEQDLKEEIAKAKRLAKKAKYDPTTPRTVLEIQAARAAAAAEEEDDDEGGIDFDTSGFEDSPVNGNGKRAAQNAGEDEEDSPNESDFVDDVDDEDEETSHSARLLSTSTSSSARPSITELRARLQARIAEKSSVAASKPALLAVNSANGDADSSNMGDVSVASEANRDALLEERRKRRGELRDNRRKLVKEKRKKEREMGIKNPKQTQKDELATGSSLPLSSTLIKKSAMSDLKKQLKKEGKRSAPVPDEAAGTFDQQAVAATRAPSNSMSVAQTSRTVVPSGASTNSDANPTGSISFSSLDFTPSSAAVGPDAAKLTKKQRLALGNSTRTGITSNDPSIALNSLQKRKEFLEKLTPQARERAEEKDKWERMELKAKGTKVFDEEAKLKKMVKRKEKAKDKSRKDWADRKEAVVNAEAAKQKRRTENIAARLQQRKDKKMGVKPSKSIGKTNPKKKGRPGFEGKGSSKRK